MNFKLWESQQEIKVLDTANLTDEDQSRLGNAAIAGNGVVIGYHVTDNPEQVFQTIKSSKKLTATYGKKSKYAELGPGLYLSAIPNYWMSRSVGKWDFLSKLTPQQRKLLADKIKNDSNIVGQKYKDNDGQEKIYQYISKNEKESAYRDIDLWLKTGHDPVIVGLAGQPYNIKFWQPEYLKELGIEASKPPFVVKVTCSGKFVNMDNHVGDWPFIANMIRAGYDGAFVKGGFSGNPEMVVWKKECIRNIEND